MRTPYMRLVRLRAKMPPQRLSMSRPPRTMPRMAGHLPVKTWIRRVSVTRAAWLACHVVGNKARVGLRSSVGVRLYHSRCMHAGMCVTSCPLSQCAFVDGIMQTGSI